MGEGEGAKGETGIYDLICFVITDRMCDDINDYYLVKKEKRILKYKS